MLRLGTDASGTGRNVDRLGSLLFMYLGRRGSLGRFSYELAAASRKLCNIRARFALSSFNDMTAELRKLDSDLLEIDTFDRVHSHRVVTSFPAARRRLLTWLKQERPNAVVNLMPHIWTPLLRPEIQRLGIPYITVIHDVVGHRGDNTGYITPWLTREARKSDIVVTLSRTVADRLVAGGYVLPNRVRILFHPDLTYGAERAERQRVSGTAFKLLFFGRILKYKGLQLLLSAVEMARNEGVAINFGVAGSGNLRGLRARLASLGAEVVNRWLEDHEVAPLLARYDAIALSHIEATQSGVAALAFGNCMPVIGMPVRGITEQVIDGRTGVLARQISARSLADAIRQLATDAALYSRISRHLKATAHERSAGQFVDNLIYVIQERQQSLRDPEALRRIA